MKYYIINPSLNKKKVGAYPQVSHATYSCDIFEDLEFIDQQNFQATEKDPIVAHATLSNKAILTDLISAEISGFHLRLLMSGKLKKILELYRSSGIQFYHSPLMYRDKLLEDFWLLNSFELDFDLIDLQHSSIVARKVKPEGGTYLAPISFDSVDQFLDLIHSEQLEGKLYFKTINFTDEATQDLITLRYVDGGARYFASERLKKVIEEAGCLGIEFQPSSLSFTDWVKIGGEREKIYGKI